MFGNKQQKEIQESLKNIEKQLRDIYHFMSSDMACIEQELQEIQSFMSRFDLNNVIETMQYFNQSTNYISDLIENAIIESDNHNEDNLNGRH